jgi:uncharacterized protein (DUF1697 family)
MAEHRYVALLRGINVGGANLVKMVDLKQSFEAMGFESVRTYIQSGNVLFAAKTKQNAKSLVARIERALAKRFGAARIVIVSTAELSRVVKEAPKGFGTQPKKYRYDVLFVKAPLTAKAALAEIPTNPEVDTATAGKHAVYFRRLIAKATQSRLSRVVALPIYKNMTIRNWNTTTKLLAMATSE